MMPVSHKVELYGLTLRVVTHNVECVHMRTSRCENTYCWAHSLYLSPARNQWKMWFLTVEGLFCPQYLVENSPEGPFKKRGDRGLMPVTKLDKKN